MTGAERYIQQVTDGSIVVCSYVKLAVQRHLDDIDRQNTPDFPYWFDRKAAERKIQFTELLRHIEGPLANAKAKFKLEDWQQFIDWCLFGWKRVGTNTRRFRKAYIEVARKNGKSLMASAATWYCAVMDGEEGPQIYSVATKREQAMAVWKAVRAQIDFQPSFKNMTKTYQQNFSIVIPSNHGVIRPLGRDHKTEDGLNPHFVCVDEYHAHPTSEMLNVMENGMGARSQPLMYIITTAGFDMNCPCYQEERHMVTGILEGTMQPRPENVFGIIYTLDEGDDWQNPNCWSKANPNLGVSVSYDFIDSQVTQALALPQKQNDVKTKNFNIWTQAVTRWILPEVWERCAGPNIDMVGRTCYGAFDLSSTTDITAWILVFPPKDLDGKYTILPHFFIPSDGLLDRERRDKVPYTMWRDMGLLTTTPGNVIDYEYIEEHICNDAEKYDLVQIAYDPYNAKQVVIHLTEKGLDLVAFRQGDISMNGPTKDFEKKILNREINHMGNPIMRWMISCTELMTGKTGLVKPIKPPVNKYGKRIDGVVAAIMAMERAVTSTSNESIYERQGVRSL